MLACVAKSAFKRSPVRWSSSITAPSSFLQAIFFAVSGVDGIALSRLLARTSSAFKLRAAGVFMIVLGVPRILRGVTARSEISYFALVKWIKHTDSISLFREK